MSTCSIMCLHFCALTGIPSVLVRLPEQSSILPRPRDATPTGRRLLSTAVTAWSIRLQYRMYWVEDGWMS